ncbi:hypothetical protein BaRGS_00006215, partial [Batillaria attramentaria]
MSDHNIYGSEEVPLRATSVNEKNDHEASTHEPEQACAGASGNDITLPAASLDRALTIPKEVAKTGNDEDGGRRALVLHVPSHSGGDINVGEQVHKTYVTKTTVRNKLEQYVDHQSVTNHITNADPSGYEQII